MPDKGEDKKRKYVFVSGTEALAKDVPEIKYLVEGKLREKARYAVIGKWKAAKSFFTMQAGMAISSGSQFLGFNTKASNTLYINFEISSEKFQQRIQDMHAQMGVDLSRFKYVTITDLSLDESEKELRDMLSQSRTDGFPVELLVIDPRWKAIKGDSNQDEVVNAFCTNVDKIIAEFGVTVIVVHHEGTSTPSDKAGKGSTVFDAWLDGWFKILPQQNTNFRSIDIWSRDSEREKVGAEFDYPLHVVNPEVITERTAKVSEATKLIVEMLKTGEKLEKDVRFASLKAGVSEYAFYRAADDLETGGEIVREKATGQGNRKVMRLSK
jgi:RecA-family ATPase